MKLFNHANQEVQRHATGAMRNLVYDNADNKLALVEENGIFELLRALREQDDELRKNVTGGPGHYHACYPARYPAPLPPDSRTSRPSSLGPHLGMSLWSQPPPQGPHPQGSSSLPCCSPVTLWITPRLSPRGLVGEAGSALQGELRSLLPAT